MNKLKFVIIGPKTKNTEDLVSEIKKRNHQVVVLKLNELIFKFIDKKFKVIKGNINLDYFDIYIFRAFDRNTIEAQVLIKKLIRGNKVVIDDIIGNDFISGKIFEASRLIEAGVNIPNTWQALCFSSYKKLLSEIVFPVIVKPICGQKGKGLKKINSKKEYLDFFKHNEKGYFIQKYLPIKSDFRVMVVGNNALGAIERFIIKGDFRSNTSLGSKVTKALMNKDMKEIAIAAAKALNFEIAGVDLAKYKNKYYVLEVNHTPQWQKFKKLNKINPAEYIIDYALNKFRKASNFKRTNDNKRS